MEQIETILHEYDTLRDEVIENVGRQQSFQSLFIAGLIAFLGVASDQGNYYLIVTLPIAIVVLAALEAVRQFSLLAKAKYLAVLEDEINGLANKRLLAWQSSLSQGIQMRPFRIHGTRSRHRLVNTHLMVISIYPISLVLLFVVSTVLATIYLNNNLQLGSGLRGLSIIVYITILLSTMGLILYSRLSQEDRLLELYEGIVREARGVGLLSQAPNPPNNSLERTQPGRGFE
jgi:hypothetical protein